MRSRAIIFDGDLDGRGRAPRIIAPLQHLFDPIQWQRDIERIRKLEDEGWRVIRVTRADLANPRDLIARIHAHIRTRGGRLV